MLYKFIILFLLASQLIAMPTRGYGTQKRAIKAGFTKEYVKADIFSLTTYYRFIEGFETIRIYIEGDGRAWESKTKLSMNPTPSNPVALKLAIVDPLKSVAYIARPGQFQDYV